VPRIVRTMSGVVICGAVGVWLFADTVRHYWLPAPDGVVRFSYWGDYQDHEAWTRIAAAFEAANPGVSIRQEWLPLSGYLSKIDHQLIAGDAPDVIMFQDEPFPRYARGHFEDLSTWLSNDESVARALDDCWPTAVDSFQYEGRAFGVPLHGGNVLIFCNPDAFDRASRFHGRAIPMPSPDWTLDDFVALCRDLTIDEDGDGEPEQFGFLQPHWVYYLPFIWSCGADLLDESRTRWTLTGPAAVEAFALYGDLRHRYRVTPTQMEYAGQNSDTAFLSGRVAMCVTGPWFMPMLNRTNLRGRYHVAPIPSGRRPGRTRVTWDGLCINASSSAARRDGARRFLRFVLCESAQSVFAREQRAIPARRAVAGVFVAAGGGAGSPAASFLEAMSNARMQPITADWLPMSSAIRNHLQSTLLDGPERVGPADAVRRLAEDSIIRASFEAEP